MCVRAVVGGYVHVHVGTCRGLRRRLSLLELELQVPVTHPPTGAGN